MAYPIFIPCLKDYWAFAEVARRYSLQQQQMAKNLNESLLSISKGFGSLAILQGNLKPPVKPPVKKKWDDPQVLKVRYRQALENLRKEGLY